MELFDLCSAAFSALVFQRPTAPTHHAPHLCSLDRSRVPPTTDRSLPTHRPQRSPALPRYLPTPPQKALHPSTSPDPPTRTTLASVHPIAIFHLCPRITSRSPYIHRTHSDTILPRPSLDASCPPTHPPWHPSSTQSRYSIRTHRHPSDLPTPRHSDRRKAHAKRPLYPPRTASRYPWNRPQDTSARPSPPHPTIPTAAAHHSVRCPLKTAVRSIVPKHPPPTPPPDPPTRAEQSRAHPIRLKARTVRLGSRAKRRRGSRQGLVSFAGVRRQIRCAVHRFVCIPFASPAALVLQSIQRRTGRVLQRNDLPAVCKSKP